MGGLEVVLLAAGFAVVATFTSISIHFAHKRATRRMPLESPVPDLEARLQPTDVPLKVRVLGDASRDAPGTRIEVQGVCERLTLRAVRAFDVEAPGGDGGGQDALAALRTAHEVEIGDPELDRAYFIGGPAPLVHALLDAETRRQLRVLTGYLTNVITVQQGRLYVDVSLGHREHSRAVEDRGRAAVALARRLLAPEDIARRLAHNVQADPVPEVRLRNLYAAVREDPAHPAVRAALEAATSDRDPVVRLRAAVALGPEGRETLLSMIDAYQTDDGHRESAIRTVGDDAPEELILRVLRRCLGMRPGNAPDQPRSARACVAALAGRRTPEAISSLQALLLTNPFLAADAARALARLGAEEAEAILIGALDADLFESRLAAAEMLGEIGTIAAVPPLREAERHGMQIRHLARLAIAAIQARATEAPGAVSLAGAEAGQVSMADDPSGQVSLPQDRKRGKG